MLYQDAGKQANPRMNEKKENAWVARAGNRSVKYGSRNTAPARRPFRGKAAGNVGSDNHPEVKCWLEQLAHGNIAAFWELWTHYQQQLFFICLRYMGNAHADAEDALSQVREKARHMLPRAASRVRNPKAWLTRVAVNQCIDIQRNQQRHQRQTVHLDASDADDLLAAVAARVLPAHNLVLWELKTAIDRAIHALPTLMRDASILYFLEERSYQEIAVDLNISYANARKRIQKARTILRASLDHRDQLPFGQNTL